MKELVCGVFLFAVSVVGSGDASAEALKGRLSSAEILQQSSPTDWRLLDPSYTLYIELDRGMVIVALSETLVPDHVEQVRTLARAGFYDGLSFYRVIDGFVAQGGDVFGRRDIGDAQQALKAVFDQKLAKDDLPDWISDKDGYADNIGFLQSLPVGYDSKEKRIWGLHCTGAFALGREIEKDTASTEFYITLQPHRYLDRNMSVLGRVVQGMEHLQALRRVAPAEKDGDDIGEIIVSMRLAEDVPADQRQSLEILRSDTETFKAYAEARRNRPEDFFYYRPDHLDVCALAIPVREKLMVNE